MHNVWSLDFLLKKKLQKTLLGQSWGILICIIQPVHSEGDQPWDYFGGNDAEAETPVLWPPHGKS